MDLSWLRDFEALSDAGNFSRAAELRHVTQPAFSRRIRALEEWAGTALFDRRRQPIALTEAGRRLRPLLADILRRLDAAREEAGLTATGSLRFAATHALSFSFVPSWLREFGPRLPSVAIHLISDGLEACERLMLAGQAEFLLCHHHEAAPSRLEAPAFVSRCIGRDRLRLLSAPDLDGEPRFRLGEPSVPILGYGAGSGLGRIIAAVGPGMPRPAFTSHLAATLRSMALESGGLAWLPESLVADDLADHRLVQSDVSADIPVEIRIYRPAVAASRAGNAFWATLSRAEGV